MAQHYAILSRGQVVDRGEVSTVRKVFPAGSVKSGAIFMLKVYCWSSGERNAD